MFLSDVEQGGGSSLPYALGFLCGFLLVMLIRFVPEIIAKRKGKKVEEKYDERQLQARGKAYRISFFLVLSFLVIDGYMMQTGNMLFASMGGQILIILLAVVIFATICILNDAYMTIKEKPRQFNIIGIIIIAINLLSSIEFLQGKEYWLEDGRISTGSTNIMCAISFVIILLVYNIKRFMDREEE